ncbi:Hypothetical protein CINCED_3A007201, partial [Cinara cedri]
MASPEINRPFYVIDDKSNDQPASSPEAASIIPHTTDSNGSNKQKSNGSSLSDSLPKPTKKTIIPSNNTRIPPKQETETDNDASPNVGRSSGTSSNNGSSPGRNSYSFPKALDDFNGSTGEADHTPPAYNDPFSKRSIGTSSNDSDGSSDLLIRSDEKTNRFWQKVKYLLAKKKIIMPFTALVTMLGVASTTKPLIEVINMNNGINAFNIIGGVVLASLALFGCWALIQSFRTKEHKITKRQHSEVLAEVVEKLPKDKLIKYIMIDRSNGTRSYFQLQTLESEIDKSFSIPGRKIVKGHFMSDWLCAISNRRMAAPVLFTALVFGNITLLLTNAMSSELSYSQILSPALYTNLHAAMVPTLLALGLMMICIISNICNTEFKTALHIDNVKNRDHEKANTTVMQCIKDQLRKEDDSRSPKEGLSSKITHVVAELQGAAEYICA